MKQNLPSTSQEKVLFILEILKIYNNFENFKKNAQAISQNELDALRFDYEQRINMLLGTITAKDHTLAQLNQKLALFQRFEKEIEKATERSKDQLIMVGLID